MTTPGPSIGFRDWDRTTHFAGNEKFSFAGNVNNTLDTGAIYAGDYGYLNIALNCILVANQYHVQVNWFTDKALTGGVIAQNMVLGSNRQGAMQFPVISEWVEITLTNIQGTPDAIVGLSVFGTNAPAYAMRTGQPAAPLIYFPPQSVAAGATPSITATSTIPGRATLHVEDKTSTSWRAELRFLDRDSGTYLSYAFFHGGTVGKGLNQPISLLATQHQLVLYNDDTVANTMQAALISDG